MRSDASSFAGGACGAPAVEVERDLRQPLEDLARALGQPPARIVNRALAEYLERRARPDRERRGSTSSYIEMTAREELHDIF
jgi:predicted transcriptional regulator